MTTAEYKFIIPGNPVTKKNSPQIFRNKKTGRPFVSPSDQYKEYEKGAGWFLKPIGIDYPVNVKCVYYMQTRRKVDLGNLLAATCDILVKYGVLADDNSGIVVSHDGSRVEHDRENPRVEIEIREAN